MMTSTVVEKPGKEQPTTAALLAETGSGPTCSFCQQAHASHSCGVVAHPLAIRQVLLRSGRCFICLRRGHTNTTVC